MKRIFTLMVAAALALTSAQATDYTGTLTVNVNGTEATPTQSTISIDKAADGTYNLQLKNFVLTAGTDVMPVGTININGVRSQDMGNATLLAAAQDITIANGDAAGVDMWMGPLLGQVPVEMVGELKDGKFHTSINIEFGEMEISVEFGDGYQLPNAGFENYHTATYKNYSGNEANGWHNFLSGQGNSYLLGFSCSINTQGDNFSTDVRPGSTGSKSLLLLSKAILSIPANGTVTTGRMNVGSMTAADASNYAFNDMSKTDVDANGDPFYVPLNGQPDSLTVWVKFAQKQTVADAPYASVSAVINDGTEYRDPETGTNAQLADGVVAKAQDKTIAVGGWRRLSIPFDYDTYASNNAATKAILVTLSTNAIPGKGSKSGSDSLYVDDIALVYNADLTSLKYDGKDIAISGDELTATYDGTFNLDKLTATSNGRGAYILKEIDTDEDDDDIDTRSGDSDKVDVNVTVVSADLHTVNSYYVTFTKSTAGVSKVETDTEAPVSAVYNINGQQVSDMSQSGVYIIKKTDGSVRKVMKK